MGSEPAAGAFPLLPGAQVGRWRLVEPVHRGGMAVLWSVVPADVPGRPAGESPPAIMKIPLLQEDPTSIVGFEVEQMILPRLRGPHVPRVMDIGGFDTQPFIVMERLGEPSLRPRLDESPLHFAEVARLGVRIAEALHELHGQHVIHHDIKPSNIMFRPGGAAVLIDFGLARHERLPDLLAEQFRLPLGTGPYISPEQVLRNRNDPRSDLFALGVVLYHLATGERPFGAPTSVGGLRRRLYEQPVAPRAIEDAIPEWLQEIILRCLEVDAGLRYASAAQLAFELANPGSVALTARARRMNRRGRWPGLGRILRSISPRPLGHAPAPLRGAPIVMAAIDFSPDWEAISDAIRTAARRVLLAEPAARLACVTVLRTNRIAIEAGAETAAPNRHVQRLVQLQHWARPLGLPPERLSFHVLEAPDPAGAVLEYARANRVDHILVGSRGASSLKRYLGSVSTQLVAEAPCTVTVVKVAREERESGPAQRREPPSSAGSRGDLPPEGPAGGDDAAGAGAAGEPSAGS